MTENLEGVAPPESFANPKELDLAVHNAVEDIKRIEGDPVAKAGNAAGELGFLAALGDVAKSHWKDTGNVMFKDAKVGLMSVIGLVPLAKELTGPAKALREANKVAFSAGRAEKVMARATDRSKGLLAYEAASKLRGEEAAILKKAVGAIPEGSKAAIRLEEALAAKYSLKDALYVAEHGMPPKGIIEKGWRGVKHMARSEISKLVDPFPDVPEQVKKAMGAFDMVSLGSGLLSLLPPLAPVTVPISAVSGMIGIGVPAAWQYIQNRFEIMKIGMRTSEKTVGVVKDHIAKKLKLMKNPESSRAAQAFT